uniref:Uncharacterized protein n=1 Tax=Rhodnius prolixus TaxID=13249 RepID=T1I555_RHOPR
MMAMLFVFLTTGYCSSTDCNSAMSFEEYLRADRLGLAGIPRSEEGLDITINHRRYAHTVGIRDTLAEINVQEEQGGNSDEANLWDACPSKLNISQGTYKYLTEILFFEFEMNPLSITSNHSLYELEIIIFEEEFHSNQFCEQLAGCRTMFVVSAAFCNPSESSPTVLKSIEKLINEKIKYALNNLSKLKRTLEYAKEIIIFTDIQDESKVQETKIIRERYRSSGNTAGHPRTRAALSGGKLKYQNRNLEIENRVFMRLARKLSSRDKRDDTTHKKDDC